MRCGVLPLCLGLVACPAFETGPLRSLADAGASLDAETLSDLGPRAENGPSGSRLRAVFAEAPGGARSFQYFIDREFGFACRPRALFPRRARPEQAACLPIRTGNFQFRGFEDEVLQVEGTVALGTWVRVMNAEGEVGVVEVGALLDDGPSTRFNSYESRPVPLSRLVRGTVTPGTPILGGRLQPYLWRGTDGSRGVVDMADLAEGPGSCIVTMEAGQSPRCTPRLARFPMFTAPYRDRATCALPVATISPVIPEFQLFAPAHPSLTLFGDPAGWFEGRPTAAADVVMWTAAGGCGAPVTPTSDLFVFTPFPRSRSLPVDLPPGGRLRPLRVAALEETGRVDIMSRHFWDASEGGSCRPVEMDGQVLCAGTPFFKSSSYADAACTELLPSLPPGPTHPVFMVGTGELSDSTHLLEVQLYDATRSTPIDRAYARVDGVCREMRIAQGLRRYEPVPATRLESLVLVED